MIGKAQTNLLQLAMLNKLQKIVYIQMKSHKMLSFNQVLIATKAKVVLQILPKRDLVKN